MALLNRGAKCASMEIDSVFELAEDFENEQRKNSDY